MRLLGLLTIALFGLAFPGMATAGVITSTDDLTCDMAYSDMTPVDESPVLPTWEQDITTDLANVTSLSSHSATSVIDTATYWQLDVRPIIETQWLQNQSLPPDPLLDGLIRPS